METANHPAGEGGHVVVIGAGIVGLACALSLVLARRKVVLVDPGDPVDSASYGNAGGLSAGSILPLSGPGIVRQIPGWLADPLGPLALRWSYLPSALPWLLRFVRAGRPELVTAQAAALRSLLGPTLEAYRPLIDAARAHDLIHRRGHLTAYRKAESLERDRGGWALRRELGVGVEELSADELRDIEPALSPEYRFGMLIAENGHCSNPHKLLQLLLAAVVARGGALLRERAVDFVRGDGRVTGVRTDAGVRPAEHVVVAAGAWSRPLAARLGDAVPLETERGYHVTVADPGVELRLPVLCGEGRFATTSMETGLRFAGTVELAGLRAAPDWRRAQILLTQGRRLLPGLRADIGESQRRFWMGHRPSLPDSLPVIGPASGHGNVFYAFGHGHVGLAGASMTGRTIAALVEGTPPPIDIAPFSVTRFGRMRAA